MGDTSVVIGLFYHYINPPCKRLNSYHSSFFLIFCDIFSKQLNYILELYLQYYNSQSDSILGDTLVVIFNVGLNFYSIVFLLSLKMIFLNC